MKGSKPETQMNCYDDEFLYTENVPVFWNNRTNEADNNNNGLIADQYNRVMGRLERYSRIRKASFLSWGTKSNGENYMLIRTQKNSSPKATTETDQVYRVSLLDQPSSEDSISLGIFSASHQSTTIEQITFYEDAIHNALVCPSCQGKHSNMMVFQKDTRGNERYQIFLQEVEQPVAPTPRLLTDGKSRHTKVVWNKQGTQIAFGSTERTGKDRDVVCFSLDPLIEKSQRQILVKEGGSWDAVSWSYDGKYLLVRKYVSINESSLYIINVSNGNMVRFEPEPRRTADDDDLHGLVATPMAEWTLTADRSTNKYGILYATDQSSSHLQLKYVELDENLICVPMSCRTITHDIPWSVSNILVPPAACASQMYCRNTVFFVTNEGGYSMLYALDMATFLRRKLIVYPRNA